MRLPKTCQRINKSIFFIPEADFSAENRYFYVAKASRGARREQQRRARR